MPNLPIPFSDFNIWGQEVNDFLGVSHNNDGSLKHSSSQWLLPLGGTAGQVPVKQSSAEGDTAWANPAKLSDNIPVIDSGAGHPGTSLEVSRSDHTHPAPGVAAGDQIFVPGSVASGLIITAANGLYSSTSFPAINTVAVTYPFYLTNDLPTSNIGIGLLDNGSGADIRIRVAIYNNHVNANGDSQPQGLAFSDLIGTGGSGVPHVVWGSANISLTGQTTYWAQTYISAGATPPGVIGIQRTRPMLIGSGATAAKVLSWFFQATVGTTAPPDPISISAAGPYNAQTVIPLMFKVV